MNILTDEEIEELYFSELDNRELSFARAIEAAVLAKLAAQDVEPVAYMYEDHGEAMFGHPDGYYPKDATPIYTEAQLIAARQRTAEACAKVCDEIAVTAWGCDSRFAEAIRNGAWRDHK